MDHSQLQQDLTAGTRDATYRAMSFIARRGGPHIKGVAGNLADLDGQRVDMLAWLKAQPRLPALAADYLCHCEQWSPIFRD